MKFEHQHHPANQVHGDSAPGWLSASPTIHLEGARKEALEIGRNRLMLTGVLLAMAFAVISGRLIDLASSHEDGIRPQKRLAAVGEVELARADIFDRNGILLATNLPTASLFANPQKILNVESAVAKLAPLLPDIDPVILKRMLTADRAFVWLQRNLTPNAEFAINALGIPGIDFERTQRRVYPHGRLFSHALGRTDVDSKGISGVEGYFDSVLRRNRAPLHLALDLRIQSILRSELQSVVSTYAAAAAAGLVMDVQTGEVVATVSLPEFDPNHPVGGLPEAEFNRVTKAVYEMGSTFKLFTMAMGLDSRRVKLDDRYDARAPIRVARFTIKDYHGKGRWLSVPEILIHSSNIGAAKMAVDVGTRMQRKYLGALGLLRSPPFEVLELGTPLTPAPWRKINTMTISYGHGIAVSPLQLTSAVAALVNGGIYQPPTIRKLTPETKPPGRRVVSEKTSKIMRRLMRRVVVSGTGKKADVPGYLVGGKTGTADKVGGSGGYRARAVVASFVAVFPVDRPKYVVLILLDEPKGRPETNGYATGGWVAAPSAARVIQQLAPMVGLKPSLDLHVAARAPRPIHAWNRRQPQSTGGTPVAAN